jgi:hypothetical protein
MLQNVGNLSLRGTIAPKMNITTHIDENPLLYLSSDGKHAQFRPAEHSVDTDECSVEWQRRACCSVSRYDHRAWRTYQRYDKNKAGRSCEQVEVLSTLMWAYMKSLSEITSGTTTKKSG